MLVKICGIRDVKRAQQAAIAHADFIGLVFHPVSKHHITPTAAKSIVHALSDTHTLPVGVFVQQTAKEIIEICQQTHIKIVQLQGLPAQQAHPNLPQTIQRIFVVTYNHLGELILPCPIPNLDPTRDYILFDQEKTADQHSNALNVDTNAIQTCLNLFQQVSLAQTAFRWFIAGGLRATHVSKVVQKLHPHGVDVSRGVENHEGEKDARLIQQFILNSRPNH